MHRLLVSMLLFMIVRLALPASWMEHHSAGSYALAVAIALLGGVFYRFDIVLENVRDIRARWKWHAKEEEYILLEVIIKR